MGCPAEPSSLRGAAAGCGQEESGPSSVSDHTVALLQIPASLLMADRGCRAGLGSQQGLCSFLAGVLVPHISFPGGCCGSHDGSHTQGTVLPGQAASPCDDGVGLRSWLL